MSCIFDVDLLDQLHKDLALSFSSFINNSHDNNCFQAGDFIHHKQLFKTLLYRSMLVFSLTTFSSEQGSDSSWCITSSQFVWEFEIYPSML